MNKRRRWAAVGLTAAIVVAGLTTRPPAVAVAADDRGELLPKHINNAAQQAITKGLEFLAKGQNEDGNWTNGPDAVQYPCVMAALAGMAMLAHGDTPSRGRYAENIHRTELFLLGNARPSGIITSPAEEASMSMYGHGFGLLFLATAYGMETDTRTRESMRKVIQGAIGLTSHGQSRDGGWTYIPGAGDEGSVTVTQMQGLRAANNAGFNVPKGTVEGAVKYLEKCRTPEGGIEYSLSSGGGPRLAISAAAVATLYNAGQYDSKLADDCLHYVVTQFDLHKGEWSKEGGHDFYTHLYAAQAFYQAGDNYWDAYFPQTRDQLVRMQQADGTWPGDGIGKDYGTAIACIILQLPYKFLPVYQR